MRLHRALWRTPVVVVLALVLAFLGWGSSLLPLLALLPVPVSAPAAWIALVIALALVPALFVRGSPLPAALAVTVPVLLLSAYGAGRIDWLRVLKDFGVQEKAALLPLRLGLGLAALALVWALHVSDTALRLHARSVERGVPAPQARAAARFVALEGARAGGLALACALGVGILAGAAITLGVTAPAAAFAAPVLVALLLAAVGFWLARSR